MRKWLPYALVLLAGASLTAAYAPFNIWLVTPVALVVALRQLLQTSTNKQAFALGWTFGLGWFGAGISWVHVSIADFGGMPLVVSLLLMFVLCAYLALFPALSFYLSKRFVKPGLTPLALPAIWFIAEWLRSWLLTGFPWLSLGYSQLDSPLAGWLPVIGETGLTLLLIAMTSAIALATLTKRFLLAISVTGVTTIAALLLNSVNWVQPDKAVSIGMAQGNIPQSLRWVPEQDAPTMNTYRELTELLWDNDIIIWPEAAIPKLELLAQDYIIDMNAQATRYDTAIVTGIVNYNFESQQAWNNLIVLGKARPEDSYGQYSYFHGNRFAKHHLLPIGEFVPFEDWLRPLAPFFDLPMSSFSRGDFQQPNLLANGVHLAPAICFEIAFPRQVRANIYTATDFIITVSNDAWFGHSHGPAQHLQIARMRAKELGIGVIRSTNNGISAFIDYHGNVVAQLPQFETAAMSATLSTVKGSTPYRRLGDIPLTLFTAGVVLFLFIRHTRQRSRD
ncbi:apolipoprotein N-acyltransferase [Alteromonas lipolytica]|uniref:Apolipoprotein N-acyltransferase n=1 Tax=Alteromonas lipolytica TaxID=1856405 RepID=A0A1E8FGF0_9ALTE|nr:apolipoprotein N-acyltransferase [Alteromonas lipolytica]OFI34668.1 apolipoprotein N-acyltransferase [Alteromonas lipolytica]GGF53030.1 apolipoprotein N-acyltransferase [Alteromonas lipolytica]